MPDVAESSLFPTQSSGVGQSEFLTPVSHRFVGDKDSSLCKQVFYASKAQGEPMVLGSVSSHEYHDVCGERDGVEFATKKSMPSRRHPSGRWGLRAISASLVVADVPASPPPRSLISPPKPHQQMSWYSWDETLGSVTGDFRWKAMPSIKCFHPSIVSDSALT